MGLLLPAIMPWIIDGGCMLCLTYQLSQFDQSAPSINELNNYTAEGMMIGAAIGAIVGYMGVLTMGLTTSLGMLVGTVFGILKRKP